MKPSIAAVLIVKNEQENLAGCLETVKDWVDEIVILDSGSTDKTAEIAKNYQAKFYQETNWQGFGRQRQKAQQYVTADYILWLDADERITPELKQSIINAVKQNQPNTAYRINRLSEVFGKQIRHSGWYPDFVVRLYPNQGIQYNDSLVHEKVIVPPEVQIKDLQGDLLHYTYKDLHHYLVKSAFYAQAWAAERKQQGKKTNLTRAIAHSVFCFLRMYLFKLGFLDGKQGLLLALLSSHSTFIKYADLWVRWQAKK